MSDYWSKHFNGIQLRTFERLGDLYLPAYEGLPSFTESGCLEHVDVVLDEVHPDDRMALGLLLYVLRLAPNLVLEKFIAAMNHHDRYPAIFAGILRLLNMALKGVVMSLYYSGMTGGSYKGQNPHQVLEYALHCEPDSH